MVMEIIKVPAERVHVIIGPGGKTKQLLEQRCNVKLNVTRDGDVEITGESADIFFTRDVVKAIGRGFQPKDALRILDEDYNFYLIDLGDYTHSSKSVIRIKGRIIGEDGKVKTEIESATQSYISVYGDTVAIISRIDTMEYAKEAISMLIEGAQHATLFSYLAKVRKDILANRLLGK